MPESPPFSPTIALLTASRVWDAALGGMLKPLGLSTRKYGLLGHIRATPGVSFSELARRSRITVQSAHTIVAGFEADGLVVDDTGRAGAASRLRVTEEGERLLGEAARGLERLDTAFAAEHPELEAALRAHVARLAGGAV
jgi:DNA-binding MarR family transcriptional regulator